ncbi:MAG: type VII secretion integral membrane protein EccD [Saccharothrix sp.]|nr:type VII secretion integral membrane protein EccD [Saccharothrix sp.]
MAGDVDREVCRVSVVAPGGLVDLVLPMAVPVVELLPAVNRYTGTGNRALVVCYADGEPLDTGRTPAELGLRHGEVLLLRTPESLVPQPGYDDHVEAVATTTDLRPDHWRPAHTRVVWALLAFLGLAAAAPLPAVLSGGGAVALLVAGYLVASSGVAASAALRGGAVLWAVSCGAALVSGLPRQVLAGAVGAAFAAVCAALTVSSSRVVFVSVAAFSGVVAVGGGAWSLGARPGAVAAVLAVVAVLAQSALPSLSLRLARIAVPRVPENAEDLLAADGEDPQVALAAERTHDAQRFLTAALAVVAGVVVLGGAVAAWSGLPGVVLCAVLAALLLVRARGFLLVPHRVAGSAGGLAAVVGTLVGVARHAPGWWLPGVGLGLAVAGSALALGGDRPAASTRRLASLAELGLLVALFPVLAWASGLFAWMAA